MSTLPGFVLLVILMNAPAIQLRSASSDGDSSRVSEGMTADSTLPDATQRSIIMRFDAIRSPVVRLRK